MNIIAQFHKTKFAHTRPHSSLISPPSWSGPICTRTETSSSSRPDSTAIASGSWPCLPPTVMTTGPGRRPGYIRTPGWLSDHVPPFVYALQRHPHRRPSSPSEVSESPSLVAHPEQRCWTSIPKTCLSKDGASMSTTYAVTPTIGDETY